MVYFTRLLFPAILLPFVAASTLDITENISRDVSEKGYPSLTAVTVRSAIQKRDESFIPTRDYEHHYADHNAILSGAHSRFATTSMKYKLPTVNLEDIELHVSDIQCSTSTIAIEFSDHHTLELAKSTWDSIPAFFVISSHPGCNKDGGRAPHLVSGITHSSGSPIAMLTVKDVQWKDAYDTMTVKFGTSKGKYSPGSIRLHNDLRRRELESTSVISTTSTSTPTATALTSTPTTTAVQNHDISYQIPPGEDVFKISTTKGNVDTSVNISCKNCSIAGTIDIIEGGFVVDGSSVVKAAHFLEKGYFKVVANGLNAHVELDTSLVLSGSQSFDKKIATIPITPFEIPDVAAIGPILDIHLTGSIKAATSIDFTYGFDVDVPDNSSVLINVGNATESTVHGFKDTKVTALPLTASSPDFSLTLGLGLAAHLLLGVSFLGGDGTLGSGMFINMPQMSLTISQIDGVNAECEQIDASTTTDSFLSHVFPNLTHIVPQANIGVGVSAEANLNINEFNLDVGDKYIHTIDGTSFPMPTTCLMWDGKAFAAPTTTASTTTPTSTDGPGAGSNIKTNKGARGVNNPAAGLASMWWTLGMLLVVVFIVASL